MDAPIDDVVALEDRTPDQHVELMDECRAMAEAFEQLPVLDRECLRPIDALGGDMAAVGRAMAPAPPPARCGREPAGRGRS